MMKKKKLQPLKKPVPPAKPRKTKTTEMLNCLIKVNPRKELDAKSVKKKIDGDSKV